MRSQNAALGFFNQAMRLPFNLFADEKDRVMARLDALHESLPQSLPQKRFFKN